MALTTPTNNVITDPPDLQLEYKPPPSLISFPLPLCVSVRESLLNSRPVLTHFFHLPVRAGVRKTRMFPNTHPDFFSVRAVL